MARVQVGLLVTGCCHLISTFLKTIRQVLCANDLHTAPLGPIALAYVFV